MCMRNWKPDTAVCSYASVTERRLIHGERSNKPSHHPVVLYDSISNTEAGANEADREERAE